MDSHTEFIDNVIRVFEMKNEDYESYIQLKNNAFKSSFRFSKVKFGEEMEKLYLKILDE